MKSYKKILFAAVASIALGTSAVAADKLKIGTEGAYPPFNLIDASGKVVGFDIDIANALCAKMDVECEVVTSDWDGIIPALNAKKFDMIVASMSITDERKQAVDFTNPYYTNKLQFIGPKGTEFKTDKDSLKGKVIGAQRATIAGAVRRESLDRSRWRCPDIRLELRRWHERFRRRGIARLCPRQPVPAAAVRALGRLRGERRDAVSEARDAALRRGRGSS